MSGLVSKLKSSSPAIKKFLLWLLMPVNQARPRIWVKLLMHPLIIKRGKRVTIRPRTRIDILPFNKCSIGSDSTIEDFSTVNNGVGDIRIGERTRIGMGNVVIGPVTIGSDVMFAQNIVLSGLNHGFEDISMPPSIQKVSTAEIVVEDEVWIGANAVITAGVRIGKHSVIGAASVVTKNVPPYSVAVGNPAKIIKQYNSETSKWEKVNKNV
ncbi:MAG: acyltransferase [Ignavibacteriaceae bacterium]|nr:acyltransferase [Ignavibacteriaceae bacterium]